MTVCDLGLRMGPVCRASAGVLAFALGLAIQGMASAEPANGAAPPSLAGIQAAAAPQLVGGQARHRFDIPAGGLKQGVAAFGVQTRLQLVYAPDALDGKTTAGVAGTYTLQEALRHLLAGTGLVWEFVGDTAVAIKPGAAPAVSPAGSRKDDTAARTPDRPVVDMDSVTVTGTYIHGVSPDSSPIDVYGREYIESAGFATIEQFLSTIPQNFAGGSSSALVRGTPNDASSTENATFGSGVNLRGIGSGSTLVLVDGNRLAPSSNIGDFVDVSMIPVSAIERVEIMTDGASSIYGGDAVAGVVNIILRKDYEGAETRLSYGDIHGAGTFTRGVNQVFGGSWRTGSAVASYDYASQESLSTLDRRFSRDLGLPIDLLPEQERHSAMVSFNQDIPGDGRLTANAFYGIRDASVQRADTLTSVLHMIDSKARQGSMVLGAEWPLANTWRLNASTGYAWVDGESKNSIRTHRKTESTQKSIDLRVSGPLADLPGGKVRLAAGVALRREAFVNHNLTRNRKDAESERNVSGLFMESIIPLVGRDMAMPGIQRLELNLSARYDDYEDFGSTVNPKVGVLYAPSDNLSFRASYSTSFNPPNLGQVGRLDTSADVLTNDILNLLLDLSPQIPNGDPALLVIGTAEHLEPEDSRSWTVGMDYFKDLSLGRLSFKANAFDIDFRNRIDLVQVPGGPFNVFNMGLCCADQIPPGTVVLDPPPSLVSDIIAIASREEGFDDVLGIYDGPESIKLIGFIRTTNLGRTRMRGYDFSSSLNMDTRLGYFDLMLSASYIDRYQNQSSSTTPLLEQVGTVFNPTALKLRAGGAWSHGAWNASWYANYVDDYIDNRSNPGVRLASFVTHDLAVGYRIDGREGASALSGTNIRLAVKNLGNREPNRIASDFTYGLMGYDPTNADALGRVVTLSIVKRW